MSFEYISKKTYYKSKVLPNFFPRQQVRYYLRKKNVAAHFDQLLLNDLTFLNEIGDKIKALQISKPVVQTASF